MTSDSEQQRKRSGLVLPWGWLSLSLAIVAIAALGTLAVVARKQNADSLSTIALALAILSFSAQLIITLAQSYYGAQQLTQADQVNADTKSSLTAIRATSEALLSNQRDQFTQVLHAALRTAVPAAVEDVANSEIETNDQGSPDALDEQVMALEHRLLVRLDEALADRIQNTRALSLPPYSAPAVTPFLSSSAEAMYKKLTTFPQQAEGEKLLKILKGLTPQEAAEFGKIATQVAERLQEGKNGRLMRPGEASASVDGLMKHGLVSAAAIGFEKDKARHIVQLTPLGQSVASLILGSRPEPEWLHLANI